METTLKAPSACLSPC